MHKRVLDRRGVSVAVTCLALLVAAVAYAQEPSHKPGKTQPTEKGFRFVA